MSHLEIGPNNQYELSAKRFYVMVDFEGEIYFQICYTSKWNTIPS